MIELFPLSDYLAGVHASAEVAVPDAARGYRLELARCTDDAPDIWPDAAQLLRVQVEVLLVGKWMERDPTDPRRTVPHSADGWLPWGSFDAYGGKHCRRGSSTPEPTSWLQARLRVPLPGRKLRAFMLTAAAVRTRVTIEVA